MNEERIKEVFSDEAFVKSLFAMGTTSEVQTALQEKGVELTEEEILAFRKLLGKLESGEITQEQLAVWKKQAEDGELPEEALEWVAGGFQDAAVPPALLADIAARMVAGFSERETGTTTIYTT